MLACAALVCAQTPSVKVDINENGRKISDVTMSGCTPWAFPLNSPSAVLETEGLTFTLSAELKDGSACPLGTVWNRGMVQAPRYALLTGDGVILSAHDNCPGGEKLKLEIAGLPTGTHFFQAFLNCWTDAKRQNIPAVSLRIDGELVQDRTPVTVMETSVQDVTILKGSFKVVEGQNVTIVIEADASCTPEFGKTVSQNIYLNGFEINTSDVKAVAYSPIPADEDMHADADNGTLSLVWKAPEGTAKQLVYFGTDKEKVGNATSGSAEYLGETPASVCTWEVDNLYSLNEYYWRVDEVDAQGNVTKGAVWSFRPRHLAFPEAEGYGRYAIGGRGGQVVYVTNLNDDGPGSLREALTAPIGPRTVVFNVSGRIELKSRIICSSKYITIAGQTAPGKGICLSRAPLGIGSDGICRFIRQRLGSGITYDGMGIAGGQYSIVDHCSISWTIDEGFSSRNAKNITLQKSIISEALNIAGHSVYAAGKGHGYAATIGGNVGSFHHNLLAHCRGRNWSMGGGLDGDGAYAGRLDLFNNVVYNWGDRATDGGTYQGNFVNNYYKEGPSTEKHMTLNAQLEGRGKGSQSYYYAGNILQAPDDRFLCDGTDDDCGREYTLSNGQILDWQVWAKEPFFPSQAEIQPAKDAYKTVLSDVGCNMPLFDEHDQRIIEETQNGAYTYIGSVGGMKGIIDNEKDCGGWEDYGNEVRPEGFDSDWDGLPDWWENLYGSNPNSPKGDFSDANADPDHDGYTVLENYLDWMATPHYYTTQGKAKTIDLAPLAAGFTKSPVFSQAAVANGTSLKIKGSQMTVKPAKDFKGITYVSFTVTDSEGSTMTRRIGILVD